MTGDGTNDAPALAQADVGVAMNTGTMAAKEAGNMVDLDSNPTKLIEVVAIGKQLLITRGALTTFSIANDVAKYFAIIPAMFMVTYPALDKLNIMGLHTPESAILAAVIFNALIIIALVPLALRGVKYRALSRGRAAAAQPADLRTRRRDCAVPRHLAHRPAAGPLASRIRRFDYVERNETRDSDYLRADDHHRHHVSARGHRTRPDPVSQAGKRQPDRAQRQGHRLGNHRPEFREAGVFSSAALAELV